MAKELSAQNQVNPLDEKTLQSRDSELIKNIVSTETEENTQNILGAAPELDTSLLEDAAPPKSILLVVFKVLFGLLVTASIASYLFFTSQLSYTFDFVTSSLNIPSIVNDLSATNEEIITLQTDLNLNRFLQLKGYFDKFSYDGDSFIQAFEISTSQTATGTEKSESSAKLAGLRNSLKDSFTKIQSSLAVNIYAPLIDKDYTDETLLRNLFVEKLTMKLNEKAGSTTNVDDIESKRENKNYLHTLNLVNNDALKTLVVNTDFDALTDKDLYTLVKSINSLVVNDLSIIQQIKDKRIKWSDIINELEMRTIAVDSHYNEDFYDALGGIRYTSYDFDTTSRRISISGETKRFDTTNFTTIANLIDEINRSDLFKNAEMKSFSKSGSLEDGYTATLKLSMDLEEEDPTKQ